MSEKILSFDKFRADKMSSELDTINKGLSFGDLSSDGLGSNGVWDEEIKAFIDAINLKSLFFSEDWVFTVLDLLAELVSASPMVVKKVIGERNGKVLEETLDVHPALTLLEMPNPFQEYANWMYNYVIEFDLMGNAIVAYMRNRQNLIIIPAEAASLHFDNKGKLAGYVITAHDSGSEVSSLLDADNKMALDARLVWHQRRPNPQSVHWGLSPFIPNRKNILFNRYTQDWLNSFYLKGATPTMALSMDRNANDDAATRLLRSFEMAYTGRRNMRRPLLLPKGVTVDSISPSIADQQLIDLVRVNREQILNILRVPKHALSLAESGSLGSEEHKQALKFLYTGAVIPTQRKIQNHLTRKFRENQLLEEDERLEFDNSEVEILREDQMKKAELSEKMKGVFTVNEIRERVWDAEPIDGGDALESAQQAPAFPFQFSREPIPETKNDEEPAETKELDDDLVPQAKDYRDGVVKAIMEKYSDNVVARLKQSVDLIEEDAKKIDEFWQKASESFIKAALPLIFRELKKADARKKAIDDDEKPSKIPSKRRLRKMLERLYDQSTGDKTDVTDWSQEKWLDTYVEDFNAVADDAYDVQVEPVVNTENQEAIDALKARNAKGRRRSLEVRGINSHDAIGKTTIDKVMDEVEKGVESKETIQEIGKRIENKAGISKKRSELIARQEALTAVSIGKQAALEDAVKVVPDMVKVWINLGDNRVRGNPGGIYPDSEADHWTLQGETQEIDEPFSNDLMYPRDVKSNDLQEVIGCFVGETEIQSHSIANAFRRFYEGPVATVKFAGKEQVAGTPNHPVLTTKGWVALGALNKGDKLIKAKIREDGGVFLPDSNVGNVPAQFDKLFATLVDAGDTQRISGAVMDFHGDGMDTDVEVVSNDSLLMNRLKAVGFENFYQLDFSCPSFRQRFLPSISRFNHFIESCFASSGSLVGSSDLVGSLARTHLSPLNFFSGGMASPTEVKTGKMVSKKFSTKTEFLSNFIDAHGFVDMEVVEVDDLIVSEFKGHVFNLSTVNEMYLSQGVIAHNCRCDFLMVPREDIESLQP